MFIITIPVATHAVNIDLPNPSAPPPDVVVKRDKNKVVIMPDSSILWNGSVVTDGQLLSLLPVPAITLSLKRYVDERARPIVCFCQLQKLNPFQKNDFSIFAPA
jgi:hypothetical protein